MGGWSDNFSASLTMKISPRPVLLVIAVIQLCLLLVLLFSTFMSSLEQGRCAEFYSAYARNWEQHTNAAGSGDAASVLGYTPAGFAHLTHDRAVNTENSASLSLLISILLGVLALVQLWLVSNIRK
jgi:hypothetical protein